MGGWTEGGWWRRVDAAESEYRDTPSARNRYGDGQGDRDRIETTTLAACPYSFFLLSRERREAHVASETMNFWNVERIRFATFQRQSKVFLINKTRCYIEFDLHRDREIGGNERFILKKKKVTIVFLFRIVDIFKRVKMCKIFETILRLPAFVKNMNLLDCATRSIVKIRMFR